MRTKNNEKLKSNMLKKCVIVAIFMTLIALIINIAPNYVIKKETGKMNIIINNNDVTKSMKFNPYVDENEVVYMSTKDIANFFDDSIFYDNKYDQIITTSETKVAILPLEKKEMYVNSSKVKVYGKATKKDESFYLPFSEMQDVYNVEINYIKETNTLTIDSLNKSQKKANVSKDTKVKYRPTNLSKTVDKVEKGNSAFIIEELDNGWKKVRTSLGNIGYTKDITNIYTIREEMNKKSQIDGKISLVWDYYSEYGKAPNRNGTTIDGINVVSPAFAILDKTQKGQLKINIGNEGRNYINWAHNNNYKVWAVVSNNSDQQITTDVLNDYNVRETLIKNIINMVLENNLDGINIDFEHIKNSDKEMFTRFIIELAPRLREYGKVISVDVTAPDGSEDWSMCYNRYELAKAADYLIFMAYDQNGISSPKEGTTAGADWVEVNIKKFLGQEGVEKEKLILGMPFYTRLWKEENGQISSNVLSMKNINSKIPESAERVWNEDMKQYYVEYIEDGINYKIWLEEENSIKAKFGLLKQYDLAGAAYWQKDFESPNIWNVIKEELK